jgi:uncharacterized protein YbaR (Trm112 family)
MLKEHEEEEEELTTPQAKEVYTVEAPVIDLRYE